MDNQNIFTLFIKEDEPRALEPAERIEQLKFNIKRTTIKHGLQVAAYFAEAQEIYAKPGEGQFIKFIEELGFRTTQVYEWINAYKLITNNPEQGPYLSQLPQALLSAANTNPELKELVLSGQLKTTHELKEWRATKANSKNLNEDIQETKTIDDQAVNLARSEERRKAELEFSNKLKEERKRIEEQFNRDLKKHEMNVAQLENELAILRPLKKRESEIIAIQKQLDESREEVYRAKIRNNLFDAANKARRTFHDAIFPVVTVTTTPEVIGDSLKSELKDLLKMTEDFAFALKQKFHLS